MVDHRFDALARHSASVLNRRASLQVLGTTALIAAVTRPAMAQAKKKPGKNINRKVKRKAQQRCQSQVEQCQTYFTALYAQDADPEQCVALITPCCEFFGSCDVAGFWDCVIEVSQNL